MANLVSGYTKVSISVLFVFVIINLSFNYNLSMRAFLHPESEIMLLNYTDDRGLSQKVFDINGTDWGNYQARELSYLVDYFDYNFVAFSLKNGFIHFLSLSNYIGIFLISLFFVRFCSRHLNLDNVITGLLLLLFLTSSTMILSGPIFRSAKIGVGTSLMGLFFLLYKKYKGEHGKNSLDYLLIFLASLSAVLFDQQGAYLIIASILVLSLLPHRPGFNRWKIIGLLSASTALKFGYNYIIGPMLIFKINGYYPSFDFQTLNLKYFFIAMPYYLTNGLYLFIGNVKYMVGNNDLVLIILIIFYFVIHPFSKYNINSVSNYVKNYKVIFPQYLAIIGSILLILMNSLMFLKHSPLIWPDVQRVYYWIPSTVIILFALSLIIKTLIKEYNQNLIRLVLVVLVSSNILSVPENYRIIATGHLMNSINEYAELRPILKKARDINYEIPEKFRHRPIYKFIERELRNNPEYRGIPPMYQW
jgi:hypothetical protein